MNEDFVRSLGFVSTDGHEVKLWSHPSGLRLQQTHRGWQYWPLRWAFPEMEPLPDADTFAGKALCDLAPHSHPLRVAAWPELMAFLMFTGQEQREVIASLAASEPCPSATPPATRTDSG